MFAAQRRDSLAPLDWLARRAASLAKDAGGAISGSRRTASYATCANSRPPACAKRVYGGALTGIPPRSRPRASGTDWSRADSKQRVAATRCPASCGPGSTVLLDGGYHPRTGRPPRRCLRPFPRRSSLA